jgi:hypothetical protein
MKKLFIIILCLIVANLATVTKAADISMNLMVLDNGNYRLSWSLKEDVIEIKILAKTTGWIAIGFDPSEKMKDADMIIGYLDANGQPKVVDSYSVGLKGPHPEDISLGGTSDILSSSITQKNGWSTMSFQRKLATGDKFDKDIPINQSVKVIWSYGATADIKTYHETSRGIAQINFTNGSATTEKTPETKKDPVKEPEKKTSKPIDYTTYLYLHILLMSLTFLSMLFAGLLAIVFNKKQNWFKTHKAMLFITVSTFVLGFLSAILLINTLGTGHFQGPHKIIGLLAFILSVGFLSLSILHPWKQNLRKLLRPTHIWIARVMLLLFFINLYLGIMLAKMFLGK